MDANDMNVYHVVYQYLDSFDASGNRYEYRILEDDIPNYTLVEEGGNMNDGFTMTNTLTGTTTTIGGSKTCSYQDYPLQDDDVPLKITIKLMSRVGYEDWKYVPGYEQEITITDKSQIYDGENSEKVYGSWSFEDLPRYRKGEEVQYKVVEEGLSFVGSSWNVIGGEKDANGRYNLLNAYISVHSGVMIGREYQY